MENKNQIVSQQLGNNEVIRGETVAQLVHRHMMDINHTTTEEELRNVRLELGSEIEEKINPENKSGF